ncbi:MAG: DNRLRE domain-containing protein [Candidatus Aegiribacteria sp.]|nr:DNRLRE domain-containing protein [Candidatus Aegiribacteria sp.]
MMQFDLEEYTGYTIDSAVLRFMIYAAGCVGTTFDIFHITQEWDETWSGSHASHGNDVWYDNYNIGSTGWHELDITDLIQTWLSGSLENHGLVMACINNNQADSRMYSRDVSSESLRPYILLTVPLAFDQSTWGSIKNTF